MTDHNDHNDRNGYLVQHRSSGGGWIDYQGFAEIADAEAFVAAQSDPTQWRIVECEGGW